MSSLGWSILLLALAAIGGVAAVNLWQARRVRAIRRATPDRVAAVAGTASAATAATTARRAVEPTLGSTGAEEARGEPTLGFVPAAGGLAEAHPSTEHGSAPAYLDPHGVAAWTTAPEAVSGAVSGAAQAPLPASDRGEPDGAPARSVDPPGVEPAVLDPHCDCIVVLRLATPLAGERAFALARGFRRAGGKPVLLEVHETADAETEVPGWAAPQPGRPAHTLRVGILLANRHGPLNAMEYSDFVHGVQRIAESLGCLADTPDMASVLSKARALDGRCAQLDAQMGLHVDLPEGVAPADLEALAAECGLVERGNDRYALLDARQRVVFTASLGDAPHRIALLLDLPRAPLAADPWARLVQCALRIAQLRGGRLTDDQGAAITQAGLERIGRQLAERQQALVAAGIEPGSARALRMFN